MRFTGAQLFGTKPVSANLKWKHRWFSYDWHLVDSNGLILGYIGYSAVGRWWVPISYLNGREQSYNERFYDRKAAMDFIERKCRT